jgi:hypothetical protein
MTTDSKNLIDEIIENAVTPTEDSEFDPNSVLKTKLEKAEKNESDIESATPRTHSNP